MTKETKLLTLFEKRFEENWKTEPSLFSLIYTPNIVSLEEILEFMKEAGYSQEEIDDVKKIKSFSNEISTSAFMFVNKLYDNFRKSDTFKRLKSTVSNKEIIENYITDGLKYLEPIDVLKALMDKPVNLMPEEEYQEYLKLPDTLTIYRGCTLDEWEEGGECPMGISWSLDKKVAEFFAYRYGGDDMCVVEAVVSKDCVRYYTNERKEQEVLVSGIMSEYIKKPHIISEDVTDYDCEEFHKYIEEKYGSY